MQNTSSSVVLSTVQTEKTTTEIRLHSISHEPTVFMPTPVAVARWWRLTLVRTGLHWHKRLLQKTYITDLKQRGQAVKPGAGKDRVSSIANVTTKNFHPMASNWQARPPPLLSPPSSPPRLLDFPSWWPEAVSEHHPHRTPGSPSEGMLCVHGHLCANTVRVLAVLWNGKRTVWVM